jgi:cytoskeleton-associated protein 5
MQRFLEMVNFYRRFLPIVTSTLRPLNTPHSGNPKTLPWTPDMETAFAVAKAALVSTVPLAHPLLGAVLALATDASNTHVGAVLQQQVGQHWQPLGFFSKKLSKTKVNYSTFDRELLAAVSGIKHFRSPLPTVDRSQTFDFCPQQGVTADLWPPAAPVSLHLGIH